MDGPGTVDVKGLFGAGFGQGAALFPVGGWSGDRKVDVNVRWDQGGCAEATSPPCGFTVLVCNDRDHNGACTNVGASSDELFDTAASRGVLGGCKDQSKLCDDPNEAGWSGCLSEDASGDWLDGQLIVFVGVEAGPNLATADVQAGVSAGTYSIWVRDAGAC